MEYKKSLHDFLPIESEKIFIFEEEIKKLSSKELAWFSGYLWGLAKNKNFFINKNNISQLPIITIISSSQTGNSKLLAEKLYKNLINLKFKVNLINANEYKYKNIYKEKLLIIITSTQGEGEPPEESIYLYNFLMSQKAPKLKNFLFSIFGLGDSSYEFFNKVAKDFDKRLYELGGKRILKRIDADIEYENIFKNWKEKIIQFLQKEQNNYIIPIKKNINHIQKYTIYDKENPFLAKILVNQKITGCYSKKNIRHIEIDLGKSGITYTPGDTLGVWYKNNTNLIKSFLTILQFNDNEIIKIQNKKFSLFSALQKKFEITVNTPNIVKSYALITKNKNLLSIITDNKKLQNYAIKTPILEMIKSIPTKLTIQQFINLLRPITPRLYSISSSQLENNQEVHITVNLVQYKINNFMYTGGASGYLSNKKEDEKILIFIKQNNNFRLPSNSTIPIIMIGPGTGIAPFRSFMQHKDNISINGKSWLFFGNQYFTEDFLYQREWQNYIQKRLLTNINLAWSRDQKEKIYVQDKMYKFGLKIWKWIQEGAYLYVCGDAKKMAKDIENTILKIIVKYGNLTTQDADKFLNKLRFTKRYQRDIY